MKILATALQFAERHFAGLRFLILPLIILVACHVYGGS